MAWRARVRAGASALAALAGTATARLLRAVGSATLWALLFLGAGGTLISLGVLENWGLGYAFLAAGMMFALAGIVLIRGLTRGG